MTKSSQEYPFRNVAETESNTTWEVNTMMPNSIPVLLWEAIQENMVTKAVGISTSRTSASKNVGSNNTFL